ncbi:WD40 repeat [Macleaya cordata]|uniref:WD40 repeat n=1 Tax=Macleaya cordata TaxID=56857 RepID=A0A200QKB0_MACCD|nr:WD40 repeat [Macleaya cordata]
MKNDGQKLGRSNGLIQKFSTCLRIVSSGASSVASTVRSAGASVASSIVDRNDDTCSDQVRWAGFDKLEYEGDSVRQVLLLGYRTGFQVWDVEEADDVHELVSRHDGPVSSLQVLQKPLASKKSEDKFLDVRPLLVVAGDVFLSRGGSVQDDLAAPCNGNVSNSQEQGNGNFMSTVVQFYSLRSQSYVHVLKFRSAVYSVRCSSRIVAISQEAQIHCFDALTLEREYTILTNTIVSGPLGSGGIGYGPLAVGPRWLAHSGSPVVVSNTGRVSPQHLTHAVSFSGSTNRSVVAHYAKESSRQLATGMVTLGDIGYKKLSRYCSELLLESNSSPRLGSPSGKTKGTINGHLPDSDNVGMVIVRDMVSKSVISQFKAHRSPISTLLFDPSGTLLVTASIHGHNINVFRIMPSLLSGSDCGESYVHLYQLQRGFTDALIQEISFSNDSQFIMVSSSRGTSHLFALSPSGGTSNHQSSDASSTHRDKGAGLSLSTKLEVTVSPSSGPPKLSQQSLSESCSPVTLSAIRRIRNGSTGWRGAIGGAAAAATGVSSLSGPIASSFCASSLRMKYHLLIFSPSGCVIQYVLRLSNGSNSGAIVSELSTAYESAIDCDAKLVIEPLQKWDICQRQNRREREDNIDIYGERGNGDSSKVFPEVIRETSMYPTDRGTIRKAKISSEENHLYISEAELPMHHSRTPLWAKPQIYFQSMTKDVVKAENLSSLGGEIEIEQLLCRIIEAKSKHVLAVFDDLQAPKFQQSRVPSVDSNRSRPLLHQESALYEDEILPRTSNNSSLGCLPEGGYSIAGIQNGLAENGWDGFQVPKESAEEFVNKNDSPNVMTSLEVVNNREHPEMESHFKFVNNKESMEMENHFEDDKN